MRSLTLLTILTLILLAVQYDNSRCLCTCHRLAPGVGPRDNQGDISGNARRWIRFSAPGWGTIREIFSRSKERGRGI